MLAVFGLGEAVADQETGAGFLLPCDGDRAGGGVARGQAIEAGSRVGQEGRQVAALGEDEDVSVLDVMVAGGKSGALAVLAHTPGEQDAQYDAGDDQEEHQEGPG